VINVGTEIDNFFQKVATGDIEIYNECRLQYELGRGNKLLQGAIVKPTGKRDETVQICGCYRVEWRDARKLKYACVVANPGAGSPAAQTTVVKL
jgi:hypothetical protein